MSEYATETRYVLTCEWAPLEGRTLMLARQGRDTFPDFETADARRKGFIENGSFEARYPHAATTLEVRPVECYAMQDGTPGDPITCWFETDAEFDARQAAREVRK